MKKNRIEVINRVPQFQKIMEEKYSKALHAVGSYIHGEAVLRCPVGVYSNRAGVYYSGPMRGMPMVGGNLRASYSYVVDDREKTVSIGTPVDYAPHVELGTSRAAARPHLYPAARENFNTIKRMVFDIIREVERA